MPPISPKARTISFISIRGVPPMAISEPMAYGPRIMPAKSSPRTAGILIFVNSSPITFAEKTSMHIVRVALRTMSTSAVGWRSPAEFFGLESRYRISDINIANYLYNSDVNKPNKPSTKSGERKIINLLQVK